MEKRVWKSNGIPYWVVTSAGLRKDEEMHFGPGPCRCGTISDGVSINIGGGDWVIPITELREMLKLAEERHATAKVL